MGKHYIKNVRVSFPHIATPNTKFGPDGKREATFMMNKEKDAAIIAEIKKEVESMNASLPESKRITDNDKICLKDGDDTDRPEYAGHMIIKATSKKMVPVWNTRKEQVDAREADIQGGDWVTGIINIWLQNNAYGQRINCELAGVQTIKKDSFGGGESIDQLESGLDIFDDNDDDF